jgi:hypothetical protein
MVLASIIKNTNHAQQVDWSSFSHYLPQKKDPLPLRFCLFQRSPNLSVRVNEWILITSYLVKKNSSPPNQWGEEKRIVETAVPAPGSPMGSNGWQNCRNAIFLMSTQCFLATSLPILFPQSGTMGYCSQIVRIIPAKFPKVKAIEKPVLQLK